MTDLDAYAAFLAARWDEIEQDLILRDTDAVGHALDCVYAGGWEGTAACDCGAIERASADLAAKRAILDDAVQSARWSTDPDCPPESVAFYAARAGHLGDALHHLADPFRDHPDHPARRA